MSMFANLTADTLEESTDRLGGFAPLETGIYSGKIKLAYAIESRQGAQGVTLVVDIAGKESTFTQYITNRQKQNYYMSKDTPPKKMPLPGFTTIDDVCLCAVGRPLSEQATESKVVSLYDPELKREVPQSVPMLMGLLGQEISLAIEKCTVDKTSKNAAGDYVPTGETREVNEIAKVFNTATRMTVVEAKSGQLGGAFWDAWQTRNAGKTRDRRDKNAQAVGGVPGAPVAAAPGTVPAARVNLFPQA
jgi:hypothetical protein